MIDEMARRFPDQLDVQLLSADSTLLDAKDAEGALVALDRISVPQDIRRLVRRHGTLRADALAQAGRADEARSLRNSSADIPTAPPLRTSFPVFPG